MKLNDIQIRFSDIDAFNHVNNINIQHYYDYGKMIYYRDVLRLAVMESNPSLVIVNTTSNYFAPIVVCDDIAVETSVIKIGTKSIVFFQRVIDKNSGIIKSDCTSIMSVIDKLNNCSSELLPEWIESICKEEGKNLETLRKK